MQNALYQNGDWRVVPLTAIYAVVGKDNRPIFRHDNIEDAIETVDEIAGNNGMLRRTNNAS